MSGGDLILRLPKIFQYRMFYNQAHPASWQVSLKSRYISSVNILFVDMSQITYCADLMRSFNIGKQKKKLIHVTNEILANVSRMKVGLT